MRVECIKSFEPFRAERPCGEDEIYPVVGTIYTVRNGGPPNASGVAFYRLVEIVNVERQYDNGLVELRFSSLYFRPVTDISALTKLTKVRELEDV